MTKTKPEQYEIQNAILVLAGFLDKYHLNKLIENLYELERLEDVEN